MSVIAIFGPTASGKSAVAEEIAGRIDAELVSADSMQVYRGLPILTNQSELPTRLVGIWELDHEASVGEYQELAHAAIDEILDAGRTPVVVGGTGLYLRAALADLELPPAPAPGTRERLERLYDRVGRRAGARAPGRARPGRGRRRAPERPPPRRARARARGGGLVPAPGRGPPLGGRAAPSDAGRRPRASARGARAPDRGAHARDVRARGGGGGAPRPRGPVSATARHIHGLREVAELPRDEAIEALVVRTRRYAAYQRKWMRRIPGVVSLPAQRPPGELADEILEMARARQRLPARRAGRAGRPADARARRSASATTTSASARTGSSRSSPRTARRPRS